ncbi:hypothetical protein L3X38_033243 [Prunus dulcis]|uniref:Uncharacterized protein n=1 Tax=Prunus dulcis TaxID=3755 RepID=A0AAD4VFK4_PRUDU|nr:hypothetical protein L3X38_033243 [Prunus dulcis]
MSDQKLCTAKLNFALFLIAHFLSFVVNALRAGRSSLIDPTKHQNNWNNGDPYKSHCTGVFETVGANATFVKENSVRANIELYPADAATVLKEMVRRTKRVYTTSELLWIKADGEESIEGANWDAQTREKVENGRYKRPIEYNKLSAASGTPKERYLSASAEASGWFTLLSVSIFLDDKMQW